MAVYDSHRYRPPAAVFQGIEIANPFNGLMKRCEVAKIDTGADISVIPQELIQSLNLQPSTLVQISNWAGEIHEESGYVVTMRFDRFVFDNIEVIGCGRSDALVGRDVLNRLRLELDGKSLSVSVSDP
jgi:predicted aspartyl protease